MYQRGSETHFKTEVNIRIFSQILYRQLSKCCTTLSRWLTSLLGCLSTRVCSAGKCRTEPTPFTCDMSIVFLEFMGLHPLAPVPLIDVDLVIIGAKGDLWKKKKSKVNI